VGFKNAIYHWPAFAGDTITKRFIIRSVRTVSSNKYSVFSFYCELKNQRGQVIFTTEKSMIFPVVLPSSNVTFPVAVPPRHLEEHLVSRADR
jgi:acyl dehydratase